MSGMDRLTELLPCPFCGDPMRVVLGNLQHTKDARDSRHDSICPIRACSWPSGSIACWNRRASQAAPAHEDDLAVDRFADVMKAKLAKKRNDGRGGWSGPECSEEALSRMLRDHVGKGDPVDVANFAMMLHQRGERIAQAAPAPSDGLREALERIAEQQMYRSGYDQTDISLEPVLTASEMQEIAFAALSASPARQGESRHD